jgi:predicted metal-dependent hydrolase
MKYNIYKDDNFSVPIKIYIQKRINSTVSITGRNIVIRLPTHISAEERLERIKNHLDWAKKLIDDKKLFIAYKTKMADYHLQFIKIYEIDFFITILESKTSKNKLSYLGNHKIEIHILKSQTEEESIYVIKKFLIKFTERFFRNKIIQETFRLNELHFKEKISDIQLKYSTSKWGACYPDKKIIFSTKLLLLPTPIIEYVIIHELAHLIEMNHSEKFWTLVSRALPNYKEHVKWLKLNSNKMDF